MQRHASICDVLPPRRDTKGSPSGGRASTRLQQMRAPTVHADGFRDVSRAAAVWTDMTKAHGFVDITYKVFVVYVN